MKITVNNYNNKEYELLFDDLIQEIFGFSFEKWLEHKLWDKCYESYSIIKNEKMLANLCIFKTEMIVNGQKLQALQIGAVCTRKDEQGKGLSKMLMEHVLDIYKDAPAYLFANESVVNFYPRFGFKPTQVHSPSIKATVNNPEKAIKLSPGDKIVKTAVYNRTEHSNTLDCLNTASIQMFHLLMEYSDCIYRLPKSDVIVVAQKEEETLFIADIIANKPITFEQIKTELPFYGIETVEFGFFPDWLNVTPTWEPVDMDDVMFFTKGKWNLPKAFRFPFTSET